MDDRRDEIIDRFVQATVHNATRLEHSSDAPAASFFVPTGVHDGHDGVPNPGSRISAAQREKLHGGDVDFLLTVFFRKRFLDGRSSGG